MDTTTCNGARTTFRRNQVSGNRPRRALAAPGKRLTQGTVLHPAGSPRRLCQPPWTQPPATERTLLSGGTKSAETVPAERQPLFGREREGGTSFRKAATSPSILPERVWHKAQRYISQQVHGGSVSRRGHNHLQRSAHYFQAEPSQRKPSPPSASRSRKAFDARHSVTSRRKSTAALSAAVDTTTCNGAHTTFRRNQVSGNRPRRTPAALREGARGRRFSQRSGLPRIPAHLIVLIFSSGDSGARYSRCTRGWCGRRRIRRTSPCW